LTRAMCYFVEGPPRLDNSPPHMVELSSRAPNVLHLFSRLRGKSAENRSGQPVRSTIWMEDSAEVFASRRPRNLRPSICAGHHGNNNYRLNAGVSCLDVLHLHAGLASTSSYPGSHESDRQKSACRCNLDSGPNDGPQTLGMLDVVLGYGRWKWNLSDDHDETNASACLSRDEL
jgi:hypothetical protein